MLKAVAENVWVASQPLRFVGAEIGCRMTCVRLSTGSLAVHSPIRAAPELLASVADLGPVAWLIAPNAFHHLFLQDWRERFPKAIALVAPRLLTKRKDVVGALPLGEPPAGWGRDLEMIAMAGLPLLDEHVFFHRPSATLIVTDLAFHFDLESPFFTRWLIRIGGRLGELSPTVAERLLIRDRAAFRESLKRVLEWPFDRVVMAHGQVLDAGGPDALARGYDWLLGTSRPTPPR